MQNSAINALQKLAQRILLNDEHGHKARVQFLRIALRNSLHEDIRIGCVEDVFEEDLLACVNQEDAMGVLQEVADYGQKEGFFDAIKDAVKDKWQSFVSMNSDSNPAQLSLF